MKEKDAHSRPQQQELLTVLEKVGVDIVQTGDIIHATAPTSVLDRMQENHAEIFNSSVFHSRWSSILCAQYNYTSVIGKKISKETIRQVIENFFPKSTEPNVENIVISSVTKVRMTWNAQKYEALEFVANFESGLVNVLIEDESSESQETLHLFSSFVSTATLSSMASRLSGNGSEVKIPYIHDPDLANASFSDQFANVVSENGPKVALHEVDNNRDITFADLDKLSNRVARAIIHLHHNAPNTKPPVIGVLISRSINCVAAIIGVLKAGCVYLPLDPSYPKQRLEAMITTSKCDLIIVDQSTMTSASDLIHDKSLINVDALPTALSDHNPNVPVSPSDLMYVIFTSGSTGTPKGVLASHASMMNRLNWMLQRFKAEKDEVFLFKTKLSFIDHITELLTGLLCGGRIVVASDNLVANIEQLLDIIAEHAVTRLVVVPSYLKALCQSLRNRPRDLALRYCFTSGQKLDKTTAQAALQALPSTSLVNLYGSSEVAGDVTYAIIKHPADITIGTPITNAQVMLKPTTDGEPNEGEILVAGVPIVQDIIGADSASKFCTIGDCRYYKTGDIGRLLDDGRIEYIGRLDDQVKIRGFRVELGEVEECSRQMKQVEDCAAVFDENKQQLVLFVKPESCNVDQLRCHIKNALPEQCNPSLILTIDAIPLTPSGKTDRLKLKQRAAETLEGKNVFNKPTTALEQAMHAIWKQVLDGDIDVEGDFFMHGGHSLHWMQILSLIKVNHNLDIKQDDFLSNPSIRKLVQFIESNRALLTSLTTRAPSRTETDNYIPSTPFQQQMYYVQQLNLESGALNVCSALRLKGRLDLGRLQNSIARVVERNKILQAKFQLVNNQVVLVTDPALVKFQLNVRLCSSEDLMKHLKQEASRAFNLTTGPLFNIVLFECGPDDYCLMLNCHHSIVDAWAMELIEKEIASLYNGKDLPPPRHFSDFAQSEGNNAVNNEHMQYWIDAINNNAVPHGNIKATRRVREYFDFDKELSGLVRNLAKNMQCTPSCVLLTAFQKLLVDHNSPVGLLAYPVTKRDSEELASVIGPIFNTMLHQLKRLDYTRPFSQLVTENFNVWKEELRFNTVPLATILSKFRGQRIDARSLVEVMFTFWNGKQSNNLFDGLDNNYVEFFTDDAQFPIEVNFTERDGELRCMVDYEYSYLSIDEVQFKARLTDILQQAVHGNSNSSVSAESFVPRSPSIVIGDSVTIASRCLHQVFEDQAIARGEKTAITCSMKSISYANLSKLSNRVARAIIHHHHNAPNTKSPVVGVFISRSINCVAAIIGVLKAGCAYLPLDPSYPKQRLEAMITTSKCDLIIVDQSTMTSASDLIHDKSLINVDALPTALSDHNPNVPVLPSDLMYVIFTSGSTGTPKGVMIQHSSVLNTVEYFNDKLQVCAEDKVLAHTSFNFDISVLEIWCALTTGASIELMEKTLEHAASLGDELVAKNITVAQATPSLWKLSLANPWKAPNTRIIVGGEALTTDIAEQLVKRARHVINAYGPTETTIWSTINELSPTQVLSSCIGKPIWNTQVTILSDSSDGAGEILIAGDGLFAGYINQPEKTSEKIVHVNGTRFYRTGDRGRWLSDGRIEYIGRLDDQVKIRGFRVELGEVEECARQMKQVEDCAAVFDENKQQLVLFVKPESCDIDQLRCHIKDALPMQCVPSLFLATDTIPLTLNGKTNRLELKNRAREILGQLQVVNKPTTAVEQTIHDVWKHIFGNGDIDIHTNFFSLGGHSLHSVQMLSAIRALFKVQIKMQDFFGNTTISQVAKLVEEELAMRRTVKPFTDALTDDLQFTVKSTTANTGQTQRDSEVILLTGASGFVGMKVLEALLQRRKDCVVYCLSRHVPKLTAEINARLACYSSRINCIDGKAESPLLGLSTDNYTALQKKVTKIVHCGAEVNFLKDYLHLASNIESTKNLISFAADKGIPLIYISTNNQHYLEPEEQIASLVQNFPLKAMGYIQTKLVSEYLVQKNLCHYTIIRLPLVSSRSLADDCNQAELLMAVLKSSSSLGSYPDIQTEIDVLPVDVVCRRLVDIIENPGEYARLLSISNSKPLTLKEIVKRVGLQLEQSSSLQDWTRTCGTDFDKFRAILNENAFPPKIRLESFQLVEDTWTN